MESIRPVAATTRAKQRWTLFIFLVFIIKGVLLLVDHSPMLFLGDSGAYLHTAVFGGAPLDRSFLYGYVIRLVSVTTRSLELLVAFQTFMSAATSVIAAVLIRRFFGTALHLAFAAGLCLALEPLQLLYERYILTETISLFVFSLYMLIAFLYLEKPAPVRMVALQLAGTMLIGFRLSFLPIVLFNAVALPLLATQALRVRFNPHSRADQHPDRFRIRSWAALARCGAINMSVSLAAFFVFHTIYKHLNGHLTGRPPAYQYQSGNFLLADWGPVVKAEDFPYPAKAEAIFGNLSFNLSDRHTRGAQRWMQGGLIANISKAYPDLIEADKMAHRTALNALKRDPLGVASLAVSGFADYWNSDQLRASMRIDRGHFAAPDEMCDMIRKRFGIDVANNHLLKTVTNTYYSFSWFWYLVLLGSPFFALIGWFVSQPGRRRYAFIVFTSICAQMAVATSLIERPTIRYLHAVSWLFILILPTTLKGSLMRLFVKATRSSHRSHAIQTPSAKISSRSNSPDDPVFNSPA